jgi:signal recognition particle subunit SRP72
MAPPKAKAKPNKAIKKGDAQRQKKNPGARQQRLFKSLCAQVDGGYFKNALKTCDASESIESLSLAEPHQNVAVLRIDPQEYDALKAKLFLLLQTERYDLALDHIGSHNDAISHDFEKAYAFYGDRREDDAKAEVLRIKRETSDGVISRGVLLLEAQCVST